MIAIFTVLLAFPLGYFVRSGLAARTTYAVAYLWAFTFQTLYLMLDALEPEAENPAFEVGEFPVGYGVVTLGIFAVGFGLLEAGHRVARRRPPGGSRSPPDGSAERAGAVDDDIGPLARLLLREQGGLVPGPLLPVRREGVAVASEATPHPEVVRRLDPDQDRDQGSEPGRTAADALEHEQRPGGTTTCSAKRPATQS